MQKSEIKQQSLTRTSLIDQLFYPNDNSSLILFRIVFGFLLFYHIASTILTGKFYQLFIQPSFTFNYIGFDFLQPLPPLYMYAIFWLMALLSLLIMLGAWYRFAIISFTILWTGIYLMQKVGYNNHYYLMLLLCFLMCFMPANRYLSIDVKRKAVQEKLYCFQLVKWIFIAQLAIVYFFAATSKFTPDWLSGRFISFRFTGFARHPHVGSIFGNHFFQWLICYGGIAFDFLVIPLLLFKKTRPYVFVLACCFHLFNSFTFKIGIFPYLSIGLLIFFFDAEKIRAIFFTSVAAENFNHAIEISPAKKRNILLGLAVYMALQLFLPLRNLFFPGNVFWNEEGYKMSWKMMLRVKTGAIKFNVVDTSSGRQWLVDPATTESRIYNYELAIAPDMIWQYAQRLKKEYALKGYPHVQVYGIGTVSLNGRKAQAFIDPTANLANIKWEPFKHSNWIMHEPE